MSDHSDKDLPEVPEDEVLDASTEGWTLSPAAPSPGPGPDPGPDTDSESEDSSPDDDRGDGPDVLVESETPGTESSTSDESESPTSDDDNPGGAAGGAVAASAPAVRPKVMTRPPPPGPSYQIWYNNRWVNSRHRTPSQERMRRRKRDREATRRTQAAASGNLYVPATLSQQERDALFRSYGIRTLPRDPSVGMLEAIRRARVEKKKKEDRAQNKKQRAKPRTGQSREEAASRLRGWERFNAFRARAAATTSLLSNALRPVVTPQRAQQPPAAAVTQPATIPVTQQPPAAAATQPATIPVTQQPPAAAVTQPATIPVTQQPPARAKTPLEAQLVRMGRLAAQPAAQPTGAQLRPAAKAYPQAQDLWPLPGFLPQFHQVFGRGGPPVDHIVRDTLGRGYIVRATSTTPRRGRGIRRVPTVTLPPGGRGILRLPLRAPATPGAAPGASAVAPRPPPAASQGPEAEAKAATAPDEPAARSPEVGVTTTDPARARLVGEWWRRGEEAKRRREEREARRLQLLKGRKHKW